MLLAVGCAASIAPHSLHGAPNAEGWGAQHVPSSLSPAAHRRSRRRHQVIGRLHTVADLPDDQVDLLDGVANRRERLPQFPLGVLQHPVHAIQAAVQVQENISSGEAEDRKAESSGEDPNVAQDRQEPILRIVEL